MIFLFIFYAVHALEQSNPFDPIISCCSESCCNFYKNNVYDNDGYCYDIQNAIKCCNCKLELPIICSNQTFNESSCDFHCNSACCYYSYKSKMEDGKFIIPVIIIFVGCLILISLIICWRDTHNKNFMSCCTKNKYRQTELNNQL
jgi:hypothetical protein